MGHKRKRSRRRSRTPERYRHKRSRTRGSHSSYCSSDSYSSRSRSRSRSRRHRHYSRQKHRERRRSSKNRSRARSRSYSRRHQIRGKGVRNKYSSNSSSSSRSRNRDHHGKRYKRESRGESRSSESPRRGGAGRKDRSYSRSSSSSRGSRSDKKRTQKYNSKRDSRSQSRSRRDERARSDAQPNAGGAAASGKQSLIGSNNSAYQPATNLIKKERSNSPEPMRPLSHAQSLSAINFADQPTHISQLPPNAPQRRTFEEYQQQIQYSQNAPVQSYQPYYASPAPQHISPYLAPEVSPLQPQRPQSSYFGTPLSHGVSPHLSHTSSVINPQPSPVFYQSSISPIFSAANGQALQQMAPSSASVHSTEQQQQYAGTGQKIFPKDVGVLYYTLSKGIYAKWVELLRKLFGDNLDINNRLFDYCKEEYNKKLEKDQKFIGEKIAKFVDPDRIEQKAKAKLIPDQPLENPLLQTKDEPVADTDMSTQEDTFFDYSHASQGYQLPIIPTPASAPFEQRFEFLRGSGMQKGEELLNKILENDEQRKMQEKKTQELLEGLQRLQATLERRNFNSDNVMMQ